MRKASPWIDISVPVQAGMVHWPGDPEVKIHRVKSIEAGSSANLTHLDMGAHTGTHMDAPLHFLRDGEAMEKAPLDVLIGPCRVLQIHDPDVIRPEELRLYNLKKGERILFKTRNSDVCWSNRDFMTDFVHIGRDAAQYIADSGVRLVGVDYLSVGGYKKDGAETHRILLGARIWLVEGLNLSEIEPGKYDLICLPLKLVGSDGAPARAVLRRRRAG